MKAKTLRELAEQYLSDVKIRLESLREQKRNPLAVDVDEKDYKDQIAHWRETRKQIRAALKADSQIESAARALVEELNTYDGVAQMNADNEYGPDTAFGALGEALGMRYISGRGDVGQRPERRHRGRAGVAVRFGGSKERHVLRRAGWWIPHPWDSFIRQIEDAHKKK